MKDACGLCRLFPASHFHLLRPCSTSSSSASSFLNYFVLLRVDLYLDFIEAVKCGFSNMRRGSGGNVDYVVRCILNGVCACNPLLMVVVKMWK